MEDVLLLAESEAKTAFHAGYKRGHGILPPAAIWQPTKLKLSSLSNLCRKCFDGESAGVFSGETEGFEKGKLASQQDN